MIMGFKTHFKGEPTNFPKKIKSGEKIHSFREGNRWKPGMKIHMATGVRTKQYNQFNENQVVSTQKIKIERNNKGFRIVIDGKQLTTFETLLLIANDGFDDSTKFFLWFKKGFEGQIVHWTDYKY